MTLEVLSAEQNMVLAPHAWERLLVELPWLISTVLHLPSVVPKTFCLTHLQSYASLCRACLPSCCEGRVRIDLTGTENRQSNQTAVNNYAATSTPCSDQREKQTITEMPRSLTYSVQHAQLKAVFPPTFVSPPC